MRFAVSGIFTSASRFGKRSDCYAMGITDSKKLRASRRLSIFFIKSILSFHGWVHDTIFFWE